MDQQNISSDSQVNFQSPSNDTPRRSFRMKKSTVIGVLALLILVAAVPLTVKIAQQRQNLKQRAAEAVTCSRCSNTNLGQWATFQTNDACSTPEEALRAQPIKDTPIKYEAKAECVNSASAAVCTFDKLASVPDWSKGNDSLGNGDYCGPVAGQSKPAACGDKDSGWIPGPKLDAGAYIGVSGHAPAWNTPLNGKLPVAYDSHNDLTKHEYSGKIGESNWSRFLRRIDDSYFAVHSSQVATNQISTGVILKFEILRVARDSVHYLTQFGGDANAANQQMQDYKDGKLKVTRSIKNASGQELQGQTITPQLLSSVTGFDVTGLDLTQWSAANEAERTNKMIADTSSCSNVPVPQPTASTPISCEEHLLVPPADFKTDIPSFTKNTGCSLVGDTVRNELTVCGDYWESAFCAATDQDHRDNAMYACRGLSQISTATNPDGTAKLSNDRLLLYYSNRIRTMSGQTLASNIAKYGDTRGRKITWNSFMAEVKQKSIAFPYEFSNANKSAEEVRDNALQAAAQAFFGKSWGAVKEQERLNNCSTTWDGPSTPTNPNPSTQPSTSPSGPVTGDGTVLNVTAVLHGIGAGGDNANPSSANSNQDPKRKTRDAKIILTNAADEDSTRQEFSTTLTWDVATKKYKAAVPVQAGSGLYTVKIKVDSYLVRRVGRSAVQITQGQATNLPEAQLITGNANNDTVLSVLDYNMLRDCVSVLQPARACSDAAKKLATDFNDDDKVDNVDYTLFVRELSVQNGD